VLPLTVKDWDIPVAGEDSVDRINAFLSLPDSERTWSFFSKNPANVVPIPLEVRPPLTVAAVPPPAPRPVVESVSKFLFFDIKSSHFILLVRILIFKS